VIPAGSDVPSRPELTCNRAEAFRMNDQGWAAQMKNIERHVAA
jgi:hypothetical protein